MISDEVITIVMDGFNEIRNNLFYIALEALKARCDSSYTAVVSCDTKPETLYQDNRILQSVLSKQQELDSFATQKNISLSTDIRQLIKGKIYLYAFVMNAYENIKKLSINCREKIIEQCDYCANERFEKCKWKIVEELKRSDYITKMIRININNEPEITYIRDRLRELGD